MIIYFHQKLLSSNSGAKSSKFSEISYYFQKEGGQGERQVRKHFIKFKSWIQTGIRESPHTPQNNFPAPMDGWGKFQIIPWILKAQKWQTEYHFWMPVLAISQKGFVCFLSSGPQSHVCASEMNRGHRQLLHLLCLIHLITFLTVAEQKQRWKAIFLIKYTQMPPPPRLKNQNLLQCICFLVGLGTFSLKCIWTLLEIYLQSLYRFFRQHQKEQAENKLLNQWRKTDDKHLQQPKGNSIHP